MLSDDTINIIICNSDFQLVVGSLSTKGKNVILNTYISKWGIIIAQLFDEIVLKLITLLLNKKYTKKIKLN